MAQDSQQQLPEQAELDKQYQRQAAELQLTFNSNGWKEVAEPILDKMIEDVIGAKRDGRWDAGSFGGSAQMSFGGASKLHLSPENLMWYRQALIDYHNRLWQVIDAGNAAKARTAQAKAVPARQFNVPMLDGSYAPSENSGQGWSGYITLEDSEGGIKS